MKTLLTSILISAFTWIPLLSFGWGQTGHRVVGEIATRHLTPKAKKRVDEILKGESLAMVSNWMDFIKSEPEMKHKNPWHYCTISDSTDYTHPPEEGDAYKMINQYISELKSGEFSETEAIAVKSLVHIIGDVHQPLHVGNGTDRGGNDVKVSFFWEKSNLHRVWDSEIIDKQQLSYTEYANWIDTASQEQINEWQAQSVMEWLEESKSFRPGIYKLPEDNKLSYLYVHDHIHTVNQRLLQAGIRLAGVFNAIFA